MKYFYTLFVLIVFSISSYSQTGNIRGTITDVNGLPVPGATILIKELNKGVVSNFDGDFTMVNVPEGKHNLTIEYLGYADFQQEVTVKNDETIAVSITLTSKATQLGEVLVTGFATGQAKALNTQKNNQNITNVVSTDQIGKFPDANIGDAVKRIPGITMQVDQGEARNIIVRGLAPQLNSVTLNGSRIPSAEGDNRNIQMDLIPSDMIQTIEVNKAVTPDMDADALGGSVNLVTRTSPQGFRLSATAGSGVNFITDKRILTGSFLVGDRSENGKLGWMLSTSINDNDFGSDNVEAEWVNEAESPVTEEDIEVDPFIEESDIRTYLVQRIRRSFSANLDYKLSENSQIFLKTMYNWRDDRENRFRLRFRSMEPIFEDGTENIIGYEGEVRRQTKGGIDNNRNKNTRLEDQRMQNYSLSGKHLLGNVKFDWMGSFAKASEKRPNERYAEYEIGDAFEINQDLSDPEFFVISGVNGDENDLSAFELKEITEENQYTEEEDFNLFANFELPSDMFGKGDGIIKFGAKARFKNKNRDNDFYEFEPTTSGFDALSDVPTRDFSDSDFAAGSQYQAGYFVTPEFLGNLDLFSSQFDNELLIEEFITANFDVKENVFAGYVMTNQKLSDKLSVLAGVRLESTKIESTGYEIEFDEDGDIEGTNELNDENSYSNFLPGVHFKYDINNNTLLRVAWTNTIARPNYVDLVPFAEINNEDEEIVLGNSELDPTTSMNFDIMAEHYFKSIGIVSGGLFYKNIKDFTYVFVTEDGSTGYDLFQPLNGDKANVFGAEIAFQKQFAKHFGIILNYTYLSSEAKGIRNEDGDERGDLDLPGASPNMFNGSLSYSDDKFSARISGNFSDAYLDELRGNDFEDRYYDTQFFLDFNASYNINENLSIYADLNNITNQPLRYYQGVSSRTMQMEYYRQRLTFGLKYDLFKRK